MASAVIALGDGFPRYEGDVDLGEIGQWIRDESADNKLKNIIFFLVHQTCQGRLGVSSINLAHLCRSEVMSIASSCNLSVRFISKGAMFASPRISSLRRLCWHS